MNTDDPERVGHGLTPVPFAPFAESPAHPPTQPCAPPDSEQMQQEHPSIDDLSIAMARLETELEVQAERTRIELERHNASTKASVERFLSTVLKRFDEGNRRMDAHAKALRWQTAELIEHRSALGLPPIEPPSDDL